jgi:hypothetical protein
VRRLLVLAFSALVALASLGLPAPAQAQVPVVPIVLVRAYPQLGPADCTLVVAQWSDGTYTWVPWTCPAGVVALRPGTPIPAERVFTQLAANGCTEFVVRWLDGVFSWVPGFCPRGVVYFKPGPQPAYVPLLQEFLPLFSPPAPEPARANPSVALDVYVSDRTPPRFGRVTVFGQFLIDGRPIPGVPMVATWLFDTALPTCGAFTDVNGLASCGQFVGDAPPGVTVVVDVGFTYFGQLYSAQTSFTPR